MMKKQLNLGKKKTHTHTQGKNEISELKLKVEQ